MAENSDDDILDRLETVFRNIKCEERIMVLQAAGMQLDAKWAFFLQPQYQSTDESDESDVIDPDTDTEPSNEVQFPPPEYMEILNTGYVAQVDDIEKLVMEHRRQYERQNKGGTPAHARVRGDWKETPLPFVPPAKPKIPRSTLHPAWLADHEDS
ncbi:hypothetical protein B0H14DRAFT_3486826 [Mycena olivaceomarginata]|nr:hypothetical protein B0H14DRAFT_3486826 [Mycena olivaceomarginata]